MRLVLVPLHRVHSSPAALFKSRSAKAKALKCADILQYKLTTNWSDCTAHNTFQLLACGNLFMWRSNSLRIQIVTVCCLAKKQSLLWGHIEMHMFMAAQHSSIWTWSKADQETKCAWNRCAYIYFYLCIPLYTSNQSTTHPAETCGNRIWPLGVRWTWTYIRT